MVGWRLGVVGRWFDLVSGGKDVAGPNMLAGWKAGFQGQQPAVGRIRAVTLPWPAQHNQAKPPKKQGSSVLATVVLWLMSTQII